MPEPNPPPSADDDGLSVRGWWRALATLVAGAGLGSGATAVFVTQLEAGPVALLAVGLVFGLIAISGRMPWRIKLGDNEIEMINLRRVNRGLAGVIVESSAAANPDDPAPQKTIEALEDLAPTVAVAARDALGYELAVRRTLQEVAEQRGLRVIVANPDDKNRDQERMTLVASGFDALIYGHNIQCWVEIKPSTLTMTNHWLSQMYERFTRTGGDLTKRKLLVISRELPRGPISIQADRYEFLAWAVVSDPHDTAPIERELRRIFGVP